MAEMYKKVKVTGTLTLESELHIGSGEVASIEERLLDLQKRFNKHLPDEEAREGQFHRVITNQENCPYIPGSSLRGALLSKLCLDYDSTDGAPKWQSQEALRTLFGYTDQSGKYGNKRAGSKVRFAGAHYSTALTGNNITFLDTKTGQATEPHSYDRSNGTLLRPGVKIDRATGAAEDGKLYYHEVVATGAVFEWQIAAEHIDHDELQLLLLHLQQFDGSPRNAIGGKKNSGRGCIKWQLNNINVVDEATYKDWLASALTGQYQQLNGRELQLAQPTYPAFERWLSASSKQQQTLDLVLVSNSPLLIDDPDLVLPKSATPAGESSPKQQFRRRYDGRPIVPASSLKGVLRAQSERVAATIAYQQYTAAGKYTEAQNQAIIDAAVEVSVEFADLIWGSDQQQGALRFSDLIAKEAPSHLHQQSFNAIDRFTGGVKDQALYSVSAAAATQYAGQCWLNLGLLQSVPSKAENHGWQALLLFTLRDAMAGELFLGSGSSKGYGAFVLAINVASQQPVSELKALIDNLGWQGEPQQWLEALQNALKERMNAKVTLESVGASHE